MPKKLVFGLVAFLLITVASVGYLATRPDKQIESDPQPTPATTDADPNSNQAAASGKYANYNASELAAASGDVYLFFHAPWCPQCRSIENGIVSEGVPEGVTILKTDYDSNQALRQKYGITIQTTFVKVTKGGDFISKYVAYDEPTFDSVKENFF